MVGFDERYEIELLQTVVDHRPVLSSMLLLRMPLQAVFPGGTLDRNLELTPRLTTIPTLLLSVNRVNMAFQVPWYVKGRITMQRVEIALVRKGVAQAMRTIGFM